MRERSLDVVSEQFGRILDCFHDIVGGNEYIVIVDKHKTFMGREDGE